MSYSSLTELCSPRPQNRQEQNANGRGGRRGSRGESRVQPTGNRDSVYYISLDKKNKQNRKRSCETHSTAKEPLQLHREAAGGGVGGR